MNKRKILLIESDPKLAKMVEKFLGKADFEVSVATNGLDGLQAASDIMPHLILVDMGLDNHADGGYALGKSLRRDDEVSSIPLVLMVPEEFHDESPKKVEAISKVFDGYLYKPFADTELKRVVENHTGFGVSGHKNLETLDNLLGGKEVDPDLEDLVKDLRDQTKAELKQSGGKRNEPPATSHAPKSDQKKKVESDDRIKALEAEILAKDNEIIKRDKKIEELETKIEDTEMDQSMALDSIETEKKKLSQQIEELKARIVDLQEVLDHVAEKMDSARGVIDSFRKKK